ncbi:hypothetical protein FACS1894196_4970 [Clostridia bacterium]|nr:hypothetical protein FACS1894196_4970 [Clostridia bacterium]
MTVFRQDNELGNLMITGNLAAGSGTIGGFSIGEDKLYNGTSIELGANGYVRLGGLSVTDGADTGSALEGEGGLTLGAEKAQYLILGEGSIRAAFPVRAGCGLFVDPADVTTNAPNAYIDPDTGRVYRSVYESVPGATPISAMVSADRASATTGTTLTVNGIAGGGTGEYSYTFAASRDNGAYQTIAGSGAARSFYLAQTGLYRFRLEVGDSAGGAFTAYSGVVTVTLPALGAQITCNKSNMTAGGTVTWTASATGGSGTYGYVFVVYQNGVNIGGMTGASSSFTMALLNAGTYSAQVTVTDSEGGVAVGTGATVTVNAATQYARTTGTNVRIRTGPGTAYGIVTTVAAEGSYVQITAGAAGGWYPVYWNGYTGYMSAEYLQFT